MASMHHSVVFALCAAGCGGGGGDASVDASPLPMTINVSGVASEIGLGGRTPVAGVVVEAYRSDNETAVVATATTDAAGMYTLVVPTNGRPLDGFLLAKHSPHKNTYLYPPAPLAADTSAATVLMLTQSTFENASTLAQAPQDPGTGWIGIMVVDAANMPVAGATVASSPAGTVRYNSPATGLPNRNATATSTDGVAYIFSVPAGTVNVSASKAGSTFQAHDIKARADQVTTTLIQ